MNKEDTDRMRQIAAILRSEGYPLSARDIEDITFRASLEIDNPAKLAKLFMDRYRDGLMCEFSIAVGSTARCGNIASGITCRKEDGDVYPGLGTYLICELHMLERVKGNLSWYYIPFPQFQVPTLDSEPVKHPKRLIEV